MEEPTQNEVLELTESEVSVRLMSQNVQIFRDAMLRAYQSFPETNREALDKLISTLFYKYKPATLMQPSVITDLRDDIFKDTLARDFIWQVCFHFFSVMGPSPTRNSKLVEHLVAGLMVDAPVVQYAPEKGDENDAGSQSILPKELAERVDIDYDPIEGMVNNKWLIVVAMLHLTYYYMDIETLLESIKDSSKSGASVGGSKA